MRERSGVRFSDSFLEDLRDRIPISEVIRTRASVDNKKSKPNRGDYWFCCPFHGENRPSFHCEDNKGRYHCFGCGVTGNHFKFFMELDGISFPRAVEMVAALAGVNIPGREETEAERRERFKREQDRKRRDEQRSRQDQKDMERKTETVRSIWSEAKPVAGTLAEEYLRSRSIELSDFPGGTQWMPSLRFHPGLSLQGAKHPALIGGVQSKDRKLIAIWRIFLQPNGKALVNDEGKKMKLGLGPANGGAVRLGPVTETLRVTEGIETGLGVALLSSKPASVWATLSTSGMMGLDIPQGVKRLEIYADGDRFRLHQRTGQVTDPPGIAAAKKLQQRAREVGLEAVIYASPEPDDWLNVWEQRKSDEQRIRTVQYL